MSKIVVDQLSHPQKVRILYKTVLRLHRGRFYKINSKQNKKKLI